MPVPLSHHVHLSKLIRIVRLSCSHSSVLDTVRHFTEIFLSPCFRRDDEWSIHWICCWPLFISEAWCYGACCSSASVCSDSPPDSGWHGGCLHAAPDRTFCKPANDAFNFWQAQLCILVFCIDSLFFFSLSLYIFFLIRLLVQTEDIFFGKEDAMWIFMATNKSILARLRVEPPCFFCASFAFAMLQVQHNNINSVESRVWSLSSIVSLFNSLHLWVCGKGGRGYCMLYLCCLLVSVVKGGTGWFKLSQWQTSLSLWLSHCVTVFSLCHSHCVMVFFVLKTLWIAVLSLPLYTCIYDYIYMQVEDDLDRIMNATSQQGLMDGFKALGKSIAELEQLAAKRQAVSEHTLEVMCVRSVLLHIHRDCMDC